MSKLSEIFFIRSDPGLIFFRTRFGNFRWDPENLKPYPQHGRLPEVGTPEPGLLVLQPSLLEVSPSIRSVFRHQFEVGGGGVLN